MYGTHKYGIKAAIVSCLITIKPDSRRYYTTTRRTERIDYDDYECVNTLQNVACPHGTNATFTRGASRQTSHTYTHLFESGNLAHIQ